MTDTAPSQDATSSPTYKLRQSVSAFVDLLGLSNALKSLDKIALEDLPKESSTPLVRQSVGAIITFRRLFEEHFEAFSNPTPLEEGTPQALSELWNRSYAYDLRLSFFSDCASLTLFIDQGNIFATVRGLIALLASLTSTAVHMLAGGQLVRGAIETGVAIDSGDRDVLGSGIAHAYEMERDIAVYPRICVGPRLLGFLSFLEDSRNSSAMGIAPGWHPLLARQVEMVRSMLIIDPDGASRLDYAADMVRKLGAMERDRDILALARSTVLGALETIDTERNLRHAVKWHWLVGALDIRGGTTGDSTEAAGHA